MSDVIKVSSETVKLLDTFSPMELWMLRSNLKDINKGADGSDRVVHLRAMGYERLASTVELVQQDVAAFGTARQG